MGTVYLVADDKLARKEVALKIISPGLVAAPKMRKRFIQEVLSAQELTHESIVKVFHLDEYHGLQFFTMEYLPGRSLREVMKKRFDQNKLFSLEEAQTILSPVLSALTHAHARGVIHRDLKPENIVIKGELPDISVTVLDFGLARIMSPSRMTSSALAMGTAYYMSPEQLSGKGEVDERTDLYSVGVVLYELVTGEIPAGRFELPTALVDNLPDQVDEIIDKALANKPDKRFHSAGEFEEALDSTSQAKSTQSEQPLQDEQDQGRQTEERGRVKEASRYAEQKRKEEEIRLVEERRKQEAEKQAELENLRLVTDIPPPNPSGGQVWTEPYTDMEFVWVPGGCFEMGDTLGDGDKDELPLHEVCVDGFWIGKYPVNQVQWKKVMGDNPSHFKKGDDYPVENVSWDMTQEFIKKMKNKVSEDLPIMKKALRDACYTFQAFA